MEQGRRSSTARFFPASQLSPVWLSWLAVVMLVLAIWAPELRDSYQRLANPPAEAEPALRAAMISAAGNAIYHVALDLLFGLGSVLVAGLVLRGNQHDRLAVEAAFVLAIWGPLNGLAAEAGAEGWWWARLACVLAWLSWACLVNRCLRTYRAGPALPARQQIRWLWYGGASSLILTVIVTAAIGSGVTLSASQVDRHMTGHLLLVLSGAAFPASLVTAWLLPTIPDPDTLIRRTMVYGALTSIVAAATVSLVIVPALFYYELGPVYLLFVMSLWIVLSLPLQQIIQRAINRLLYGQRDEPMAVLTALGDRLELGSPETVLNTIVETVATTLKLPAVAIRDAATSEDLASLGESSLGPERLPIMHQSEQVGWLVVSPRARGEPLHERDHEILRLVARQAGPTVRAVQLNQELRRSQQQIVGSREEERRRIRRDLHDGLGPALAAIAMQADTARAVVDDDPEAARQLMTAVTKQAEDVVQEVRRLVYDLRPPALDELGLVGAIERLARQSSSATLRVEVTGSAELSAPAALEVAIYRIVAEALTNVVRHAAASRCEIVVAVRDGGQGDELAVSVEDDGRGIAENAAIGIGLRSMRDRAGEVGGTVTVRPGRAAGTKLSAAFPLESLRGNEHE